MSINSNTIAIIPARGGSKRVPGKNVKIMHGKPLIVWTIESALAVGVFLKVIVMTDDDIVANISRKNGISEVFMLPPEFATDTAYVGDAIKYMLDEYENKGELYENFILLEPTSPGRTDFQIKDLVAMLENRQDADSIVSISPVPSNQSVYKTLSIDDNQFVARAIDGLSLKDLKHQTQFVKQTYYMSGTYAFRRSNFQKGGMWGDTTLGYIIDSKYGFDIDTPEDWSIAEYKMKKLIE